MVGRADASFRFLVESLPRLLLLSVESHLKPMVEFLESIGVRQGSLGKVLLLFPPIIFCNIEEIKRKISALEKVGAVDNDVGKMVLKYPWVLSTSIMNNYEQILSFFNAEKVPKMDVDRAIRRWPHLLGCSTSKLKLMVDQFGELGVGNKKLAKVIIKSPHLLLQRPQEFLKIVTFLEDLGFNQGTVGEILCRCPEIFATSIERTLKRKLEFLAGFGVYGDHFPRVIKKYPELLVSDVERTLLPRVNYLMEIGLSQRDIAFMVRRFSPLLGYSIDEIQKFDLQMVHFLELVCSRHFVD
ncbi:transcription termination factor MTERF4, chloroplastic isoform X2 [Carica papaya]|uniref:transcription termination factor MTERF4, chloroplastic isoform X2 n=2 Tax=Carica papaya TaxID=3649 RepID=UPI000B8CF4B6|nr:transcription termination factor MTERF4, chloroplastic isoform X2 [Carica papaya]